MVNSTLVQKLNTRNVPQILYLKICQYQCLLTVNSPKFPTGPTASLSGLKDVEVRTEDVNEDNAEVISGDCPPEGSSPKDGKRGGGPPPGVVGPGLVIEG